MTDFIRSIFQNTNPSPDTPTATSTNDAPVNQIQIPPTATAPTSVTPTVGAVETQRLIKVEIPENSMNTIDAGKAQRAVRRDVVNARRDKRKAMASTVPVNDVISVSSPTVSTPVTKIDMDDKSKKMKTGKTSSVAVSGGLATSSEKKSMNASFPPTPGLLFTPEIDAAGEERIRAMEAQLESLDPDSKEAKKKRRLIRNRMSAQLHRERKKAYVGQLEDQLMDKDRELKLLQDKLAKMMDESEKLKQQLNEAEKHTSELSTPSRRPSLVMTPPSSIPAATNASPALKSVISGPKDKDDVVIKEEPQSWDGSWPMDGSWDLNNLVEDTEMAGIDAEDLLRDFDYPFASLAGYDDFSKPQPEIHAAKKNLAMMMAVMFSVSFFGNSPSFYNVSNGSNFSSMFDANPPKEFSQMSIASRIVACLENTSWKNFRDVSSWVATKISEQETENVEVCQPTVSSPSAASDITDSSGSCASPAHLDEDLIDEFEYPVDSDWFMKDMTDDKRDEFLLSDDILSKQDIKPISSMTSRLYEKLTALWREKNQVLLTVLNSNQQVTKRSIADMSSIRDGLESGNFFTKVFGEETASTMITHDQSITFLYPMSAFSPERRMEAMTANNGMDPMFLEVSCQLNGRGVSASSSSAVPMQM